jgi:Nod factor-specific ABC transporter NodJ protein
MILAGWVPLFLREMILFRRRLFRLGYIFSTMATPIIYLIAFGLGLGNSVRIAGTDYLSFLIPGLAAMSSMHNSYTWLASSLNLNRLYFKTFQIFVQAPIRPVEIMIGEVLAGVVKGLFASALIVIVGLAASPGFSLTPLFLLVLPLNCLLFANLGVITGMISKTHEDTAAYSNFFIMPMAFFSGTFFPLDRIPGFLKWLIWIMPLTHTNIIIRKTSLDGEGMLSLLILIVYTAAFFSYGSRLIRRYSE